jgi:hypothetical protein
MEDYQAEGSPSPNPRVWEMGMSDNEGTGGPCKGKGRPFAFAAVRRAQHTRRWTSRAKQTRRCRLRVETCGHSCRLAFLLLRELVGRKTEVWRETGM